MCALSIVACGCISDKNDTISTNNYVAILEEYTNSSTLIGNVTLSPAPPTPIPTAIPYFDYNNSQGHMFSRLKDSGYAINDSFKILFGKIIYIYSPVTSGPLGLATFGIYDLPYTIEDGFTIINLTSEGNIYATYNNKSILLKPGDSWESPITTVTGVGYYYTSDVLNNKTNFIKVTWPVYYNTSYTITNKGIHGKSLINR